MMTKYQSYLDRAMLGFLGPARLRRPPAKTLKPLMVRQPNLNRRKRKCSSIFAVTTVTSCHNMLPRGTKPLNKILRNFLGGPFKKGHLWSKLRKMDFTTLAESF